MKKTIIISVLLLFIGNMAMAQPKKAKVQNNKNSKVQNITYRDFIDKIWDFEKYPDTVVYKGKTSAIVDFYADWCGPCRKVGPIMEKLAKEYEGKLVIYKVNVDQEKELAAAFRVSSIPMVLFIPMEGRPMVQVGAMSEANYRRVIEDKLIK